MTNQEKFCKNLRHLMVENNYTQEDLAKTIGVSPSAVSHWCMGIRMPRGETLVKLCNLFSITPSSMLKSESVFSTMNEEKLLIAYRSLSPEGKEKAMERMYELSQLYWYEKSC